MRNHSNGYTMGYTGYTPWPGPSLAGRNSCDVRRKHEKKTPSGQRPRKPEER